MSPPLRAAAAPLADCHDLILLDLDGVCVVGERPLPAAVEAVQELRRRERTVRFLTNNASRTPEQVSGFLTRLGFAATADEVVTSAVAAARLLAPRLAPASPVLVVGGEAIAAALREAGLAPVHAAGAGPTAVVQGWHPDVGWRMLAEAAVAIRSGAAWVATNLDRTLPSPRGPLPGNGSLVAALASATGTEPDVVAGKPEPHMYRLAGAGQASALAVGDRLDTDIAGARRAGVASLLVLTGVTRPRDLLTAPPECRPDYLGADLRALLAPAPPTRSSDPDTWSCRKAVARRSGRDVAVEGDPGPDGVDRIRAATALVWSMLDRGATVDLDSIELDLS